MNTCTRSLIVLVAALLLAHPAMAKTFKMGPITIVDGQSVSLSAFLKPSAAPPGPNDPLPPLVVFKVLDDQGKVIVKTEPKELFPGSGVELEIPHKDLAAIPPGPCNITGIVKITGNMSNEAISASLQLVDTETGELDVFFPRRRTGPDADARDALVFPPMRMSPDDLLTLSALLPEDPCGIRYTLYDLNRNFVQSYEVPASGTGGVTLVIDVSQVAGFPENPGAIVGVVEAIETNGQAPPDPLKLFVTQQVGDPGSGATMAIQEDRSKFNVVVEGP